MDKLSITNLFPNYKHEQNSLDVKNLVNPEENKIINKTKYNIDKLINTREEREREILIIYDKITGMCLDRIFAVNKIGGTDVIYDIPVSIFNNYNYKYNKMHCLEYLQKKLRNMYMDTLIISNSSIFISWLNIKENRKNAKS